MNMIYYWNKEEIKIDDDSIIDQLSCNICNKISLKIKECDICEILLCDNCSINLDNCPNEKHDNFNLVKISPFINKLFNLIQIPCKINDKCNKVLSIKEIENHYIFCKSIKCDKCDYYLKENEIYNHNCIIYLKNILNTRIDNYNLYNNEGANYCINNHKLYFMGDIRNLKFKNISETSCKICLIKLENNINGCFEKSCQLFYCKNCYFIKKK